jgi:myo-inositol-1(or 4)-monophosphatase
MKQEPELIDELTLCAHAMADAAREVILPYFRSDGLDAQNKVPGGYDPVTKADREAEAAMRAVLARMRPGDSILGEELGTTIGTSGLIWVLDPIDGTRGFVAGTPTWGVLIAVGPDPAMGADTGPFIGIVDQPYIGERFIGTPQGAVLIHAGKQTQLRTRAPRPLAQAVMLSTFPEVGSRDERTAFEAVVAAVTLTRYGMDCYGYALLAAGQVDLVIEAGLQAYDVQGPLALIEAAGGVVTAWDGGPAHQGGRVLAAANPQIHAEAMALLGESIAR